MITLRRYQSKLVRAGLLESPLVTSQARAGGLRRLGVRIGQDALIYPGARFNGLDVEIGDRCVINRGCFLDGGPIRIGHDVGIAPDVILASVTHAIGDGSRRAGPNIWQEITVEDGAWIGARTVVLGGVTVARGGVIGAGSVVTKNTEPNRVYVGSPARRIRDLD